MPDVNITILIRKDKVTISWRYPEWEDDHERVTFQTPYNVQFEIGLGQVINNLLNQRDKDGIKQW